MLRPNLLLSALVLFASGCARTQLDFRVVAPLDTPEAAEVVIVSGDPAFGEGLVLSRAEDNVFTGSVLVSAPATLSYEVRLRNPDREELSLAWEPIAPRTVEVHEEPAEQEVRIGVGRWNHPTPEGKVAVTFEVTVPAQTGSEVWIASDSPELGAWQVRGLRAYRDAEGLFIARAHLTPGSSFRYALTRGHWGAAELDGEDAPVPERSLSIGSADQVETASVARWMGSREALVTGEVERIAAFPSEHVLARDVLVWLPPGYSESGNTLRYPVLYLHDGQNMLNGATSFLGEWHADETAQRLITFGLMEPVILVAVYNSPERIPEYTQVPMTQYPGSGAAEDYARFLVEELKPHIDQTYRTRTEAASTGVAGSSLGGLVSMYLGLAHPETFGRLGVISPSVWWADREIVDRVTALPAQLPLRIWLDMGTQEDGTPQSELDDARALRDALIAEGWSLDEDLAYLEATGGAHNEGAWARRFDQVLQYLYPPQ